MRMKIILAAMATSVLILLAAPQSAFAAKPSFGCSQGFDVGGVTLTQSKACRRAFDHVA